MDAIVYNVGRHVTHVRMTRSARNIHRFLHGMNYETAIFAHSTSAWYRMMRQPFLSETVSRGSDVACWWLQNA